MQVSQGLLAHYSWLVGVVSKLLADHANKFDNIANITSCSLNHDWTDQSKQLDAVMHVSHAGKQLYTLVNSAKHTPLGGPVKRRHNADGSAIGASMQGCIESIN